MDAPPGPPDRGLAKHQRISRSREFSEAYAQGRKWVGRTMVLFLREGDGASLRLGVVSSKKVGRRAHDRNRARRLLREVWRQHRAELSGAFDVVLVARRAAVEASFGEVTQDFLQLARRAGLWHRPPGAGTQGQP